MEFFVESNEDSICPICGAPLTARDHKKRVWKKERGEKSWVMIRRLVCTNKVCNHLHNELPDFLIPYKHYEAQLIEDVIDETITEDDVAEMDYPSLMTIKVWMEWFQRNISNIDGLIRSAVYRFFEFKDEFLKSKESLLEELKKRICPGWLGLIHRLIYNSGGFIPR